MSTKKPTKRSLTDNQIKSARISRRGILGIAGFASVATLTGCQTAGPSGLTDADSGTFADPAGGGRGRVRTSGLTDADSGSFADPAGNGRGARTSGLTDSDNGTFADPAGNGRGVRVSGLTDSDSGFGADPANNGRRGW